MPKELSLVEVKVIETKPAVINFNYDEISSHLDSTLVKYSGLVFTEETAAECKKTIAELRKGQKALDAFRKNTKKQLTESVTAFENQCKQLNAKFEEVIQPLTKQQDQFEQDRREKKSIKIQEIIDALVVELSLGGKYAPQLIILEEYYNKGKSIKAITADLTIRANTLKIQQDKENQDIDLVKTKVELANSQYQLANALIADNYLRLLAYKTFDEIGDLIISDAEQMRDREKGAVEAVVSQPVNVPNVVETFIEQEPVKAPEVFPAGIFNSAEPVIRDPITAVYEITGTDEQLSALEAYLDANNLEWIDRPNELLATNQSSRRGSNL